MRVKFFKSIGLGLILAAAAIPAAAQAQVKVSVNGEMVNFPATQPQMMNGRILVPLRGVMEKLGAFVSWQAATQTVIAQAGTREIQLRIGADFATVNGSQVFLDQPAVVLRGTTMVPLRFMGEALGAEVKWEGSTSTVMITTNPNEGGSTGGGTTGGSTGGSTGGGTTGGSTGGNTGGSSEIAITNFSVKANQWVRANETIEVTMVGTAGGQATFTIPGLVEQAAMREESAGRYVGSYKVPADKAINVTETSVIGSLKVGNRERLIQGGTALNVDNKAPELSSLTPEDATRHEGLRPSISAVFNDSAGSGIDVSSIKLVLDNTDITKQATVTENFIVYKPVNDMYAAALHRVGLTVRDKAGNTTTKVWTFNVGAQPTAVKSFTHDGNRQLQPGDVINFTVMADKGGAAVVKFQKSEREIRLTENPAGTYKGEYVVRRDDAFAGDTAILTFDPAGNAAKITLQAAEKIGSSSSQTQAALSKPTITSPKSGAAVKGSMTIEGTAAGSKTVQVRVMYNTKVLGGFPLTGVLAQLEVDTDAQGRFKTDPISLSFRLKGSETEYTIEVVGMAADGKTTEATTITVNED